MDVRKIGSEASKSVPSWEENKEEKKNHFCHIDKGMIPFKVHFFFFFGGMGAIFPYLPLIAKDKIGISATSLATVLIAQLFINVVFRTAIGYVADYCKRMKLIISVLIILHCLFYLFVLFIPKIEVPKLTQNLTLLSHFENYKNDTELTILSLSENATCKIPSFYYLNLSSNTEEEIAHLKKANEFLESNSDIICIMHSNQTEKTFCFELGKTTEDRKLLGIQLTFCCSKSSIQLEQVVTIMKMIKKDFFHLYSLNSSTYYESFNRTSPCTVTFSDDSASIKEHQTTYFFTTYNFWLYACLVILGTICASAAITLSDTICCESVQKYKKDFGRQRIWSASFGASALLGGLLSSITYNFFSTWILTAVLLSLTLWNLYKMDLVIPQFSQNLSKDVGTVLKSGTFLAFNAGIFINGIWSGVIMYYLVWYISTLGASTLICGLISYVQCFGGELPFMFFSGWLIKNVGHFNILSLSLLSYAVRFLWYSYLQNPWLVLPVEITHGLTYGVYYPAVTSFGKLNAKLGTEAITQSILFSTHEGLGAGLGCILAGIGFDYFGGRRTFFYFSLFAFGATFLNVCSTLFFRKRCVNGYDITSPPKG